MMDPLGGCNREAQVLLVSGLGAVAVGRPLIWTFVQGLVLSSEWKGNSDRGLED